MLESSQRLFVLREIEIDNPCLVSLPHKIRFFLVDLRASKIAAAQVKTLMPDKYKHTWILACNNERELMRILRKHGIKDEDSRFAEIVKLFHVLRGGKT